MENKSHALAAGAFVLVAMLLLAGLAWWLMDDTSDHVQYDLISKESVSGLQPQAAVRYRGVDVGKVTEIALDPIERGTVRVRIAIDPNTLVTASTFGTLATQGVTGLSFIQLDDPSQSTEPLVSADGSVPRLPLRGGLLSRLADQGAQMLDRLDAVVAKLDAMVGPENQAALTSALTNIGDAAKSVQTLASNTDQVIQAQLAPSKVNLGKTLNDAGEAMTSMKAAAANVYAAADSFKGVISRLEDQGGALESVNESMTTVTMTTLPRINRLTENLGQTLRNLDRSVTSFNENPQALIYGAGPIRPGPGELGFGQAPKDRATTTAAEPEAVTEPAE